MSQDSTPAVESGTGAPSSKPALQRYLFLLLLIPVVFLASAVPIARSAAFPRIAGDPFLLNLDYAYGLRGGKCQVLIFGDSTAVTGIDPTTLEAATGLKTCNIAQTQSVLEIVGFQALDAYLKNNPPPKFLVMQFSPEMLGRAHPSFFWPQGLTLLLRKSPLAVALPKLMLHPIEAYNFSMWAIKAQVTALLGHARDFGGVRAISESHDGLIVLPTPPQTACVGTHPYHAPTAAWVEGLRQTYARPGSTVLVNVSPLPDCDPVLPQLQVAVRGITDNALPVYPVGQFNDLDRHLTLAGAQQTARDVAEQIRATPHDAL